MKILRSEIQSAARVITSNMILSLMNDLPGFRELLDKQSRKKGYNWPVVVDHIEADVQDTLVGRFGDLIED